MRRRRATLDYFKHKNAGEKESKLAFPRHVPANGSPMQWGGGVKIIFYQEHYFERLKKLVAEDEELKKLRKSQSEKAKKTLEI